MQVFLSKELVRDLHGSQERDALRRGRLAPGRQLANLGVDKVSEGLDVLRTLVASDRERLPCDLNLHRRLHQLKATPSRGVAQAEPTRIGPKLT